MDTMSVGVIRGRSRPGGPLREAIELCDVKRVLADPIEIWSAQEGINSCDAGLAKDVLAGVASRLGSRYRHCPVVIALPGDPYGLYLSGTVLAGVPWRSAWSVEANCWHLAHESTEINLLFQFPELPRWFVEGVSQLVAFEVVGDLFGAARRNETIEAYYGDGRVCTALLLSWPCRKTGVLAADTLEAVEDFLKDMIFERHPEEPRWYRSVLDLFVRWKEEGFDFEEGLVSLSGSRDRDAVFWQWVKAWGSPLDLSQN